MAGRQDELERQLDMLREQRNQRLAGAQANYDTAHDQAWADYNRAVAEISNPLVEAWG